GCARRPADKIMPYTRQPEGLVPGKPLYYATAMALGGFATGLLVEAHEGRPTKVEGNPQHPASLGATDAFCQAAVLGLYDPDRSQTVGHRGRIRTWDGAVDALRQRLGPGTKRAKGKGVAVLTEVVGSPTLAWQLDGFFKDYPEARWYQYEPAAGDGARAAALSAFGQAAHTFFKIDQADVIVALDADFLGCAPGGLAYSHQRASRRRDKSRMNRLYAVESGFTVTGGAADNRLALPPSQLRRLAWALASSLGVPGVRGVRLEGEAGRWVDALAKDLKRPAGTTLVVAGAGQPADVHLLAHAMNDRLGNFGKTVVVTAPVLPRPPRMSDM